LAVEVLYKASALKELKRLDRKEALRLVERIDTDLARHPGKDKALAGSFKGLFSYRVGDHRIVYTILSGSILVLRIAHRRDVYRT
jgi:mRNA interferase RelE/StbE